MIKLGTIMRVYRIGIFLLLFLGNLQAQVSIVPDYPIICEGLYQGHLQGITTGKDAIFWSFTDTLVKTDFTGTIMRKIPVENHHGDLCYADDKVYVAVNLGKFNQPAGQADSWVYVYDAENLMRLNRYPVQDVVHGAGGIAIMEGNFYVVGGLPGDIDENYVYGYSPDFKLIKRYVLPSGHTHLGIQTVDYIDNTWYFGCYGDPKILIKTDSEFNIKGQWEFDAALGINSLPNGQILVARGFKQDGLNGGKIFKAKSKKRKGLLIKE